VQLAAAFFIDLSKSIQYIFTAFNLESKYPDEKRSFRKKCTEEFTVSEMKQIEEIFLWLKSMLQ